MIKVWAGLEARKFITASVEEVSETNSRTGSFLCLVSDEY